MAAARLHVRSQCGSAPAWGSDCQTVLTRTHHCRNDCCQPASTPAHACPRPFCVNLCAWQCHDITPASWNQGCISPGSLFLLICVLKNPAPAGQGAGDPSARRRQQPCQGHPDPAGHSYGQAGQRGADLSQGFRVPHGRVTPQEGAPAGAGTEVQPCSRPGAQHDSDQDTCSRPSRPDKDGSVASASMHAGQTHTCHSRTACANLPRTKHI